MAIRISATPSTDAYDLPAPGIYEWAVARVREPRTEANRFWREGDEDYKKQRTTVLIEMQVIGDAEGRYAEPGEVVFTFWDLYPDKSGGFSPSKKLWELINATGGGVEELDEMTGSTCWAQAIHYTKQDGSDGCKVINPTAKPPQRTQKQRARIARQPEPEIVEDEIPFDEAADDAGPDDGQSWSALIASAETAADLAELGDLMRSDDSVTPDDKRTFTKKMMSFRATTRVTA